MATIDELLGAIKELAAAREKIKHLEQRVASLSEGLSNDDRQCFALVSNSSNGAARAPSRGRKQDAYRQAVHSALEEKGAEMTARELRKATSLNENQMNNTLWQMRNELEKVPANKSRPRSPQNMAYRLKSPKKT